MALPNPIPPALHSWLGRQVSQELNPELLPVNHSLVSRVRWVLKALDTCFLPWTDVETTQILDYLVRRCELGDFLYRPTPCGIGAVPPVSGGPAPVIGEPLLLRFFTGPVGIHLLGTILTDGLLSWTYNKNIRSQDLDGVSLPVTQREYPLPRPITQTTSLTLHGTDGRTPVSGTVLLPFANTLLYGVGEVPQLMGLLAQPLKLVESRDQTFLVKALPNQRVLCGFPLRLGANPLNPTLSQATYTVGAFEGGFLETVLPYTNLAGYTEDYVLATSVNPNLDILTVSVS